MSISLKMLKKFFPEDTAKKIRGIITKEIAPEMFKSVQLWIAECYNRPSDPELQMCALDEVLGGFGVEAIRGGYVDRYHQNIQAVYVNMGNTYDLTILFDNKTQKFVLTSWGDWVESHEKRLKE